VKGILQRDFILGEKKYVKFKATSCDNLPIVITGAKYTLYADDVVIETGDCIVNGDEFMALIQPDRRGCLVLEVEYTVAPETRKVRVAINVT
jgi:LEA14-like dessication related protein